MEPDGAEVSPFSQPIRRSTTGKTYSRKRLLHWTTEPSGKQSKKLLFYSGVVSCLSPFSAWSVFDGRSERCLWRSTRRLRRGMNAPFSRHQRTWLWHFVFNVLIRIFQSLSWRLEKLQFSQNLLVQCSHSQYVVESFSSRVFGNYTNDIFCQWFQKSNQMFLQLSQSVNLLKYYSCLFISLFVINLLVSKSEAFYDSYCKYVICCQGFM